MKTKCLAALAAFMTVCGICRADTALPREEPVSVNVASGTGSLSLPVKSTGESRLVKTGEGTLTMPKTAGMPGGLAVDVVGGTVVASGTDTAAAGSAGTDYIAANATFWLAADSTRANFDTAADGDNTAVTKWYDVRDTNHASLSYPYADTYPETGGVSFVSPYIRTVDGLRSVYFRGWNSRCAMKLYNADGTAKLFEDVGSVFVVTRIDSCWGNLLGRDADGDRSSYLVGNYTTGSTDGKYFMRATNSGHALRNSRFYDNGVRKDAELAVIQTGVRILEIHHHQLKKGNFNSLFAFNIAGGRREGGDDLMELIVFNSTVPETDRLNILKYLSSKWNVTGEDISFRTAKGARLDLEMAAGSTHVLTGGGTYGIATSGVTLTTGKDAAFGGEVDVAPGVSLKTDSPSLAYAVAPGENIDVAAATNFVYFDELAVSADAPAGVVVKTGTGNARFVNVAEDTVKLDVSEGRVTLSAPLKAFDYVPAAGANDIYATIPNAGFESDDMSAWTLTGDGQEGRYNHKLGITTWKCQYDAPEGDWVLCLKRSGSSVASAETTVSVPATGRYALSFYTSGRKEGLIGCWYIEFVKGGVTERCDMTDAFYTPDGYRKHRLLTPELAAGEWTMRIVSNFTSGDRTSTFDDFKMKLVTKNMNTDGAWPLPNGGFENLTSNGWSKFTTVPDQPGQLVCSLSHYSLTRSNSLIGWTITPGREDTTKAPEVGLIHSAMSVSASHNSLFSNEHLCEYGDKCVAFYGASRQNGIITSDTFTPPSGTWKLRFKSAFAGYAGSWWPLDGEVVGSASPSWTATISINGGEAVSLGTKDESGYNCWKEVTLPNSFTVAEGDSVVVTIRQTKSGGAGFLDDVELVPANIAVGNLVQNGGFEDSTWEDGDAWQRDIPGLESRSIKYQTAEVAHNPDSWISRQRYDHLPGSFGYAQCEGSCYLWLGRNCNDAAWQDVAIPSNGLYRLSFFARSRVDSKYNCGHLPIRVWMAKDGVTNEIGRTGVDCGEFRAFNYFWHAPAAGTYRLGFQTTYVGTSDKSTLIDAVSLTPVADELLADAPTVPKYLEIDVADGAELALDFPGTLKIGKLKVAGVSYTGTVRATDIPGVSGQGTLLVTPKPGLTLVVW